MQEETLIATKTCPYCAEQINVASKKCRHCGEILDHQMREIEALKTQRNNPNVFMNAGGGASSSSSSNDSMQLRKFPHWMHILLTIISAGLWIPVYILMYIFRNKRYYY